eukprot:3360070-Prymnesium_polylepis.1
MAAASKEVLQLASASALAYPYGPRLPLRGRCPQLHEFRRRSPPRCGAPVRTAHGRLAKEDDARARDDRLA